MNPPEDKCIGVIGLHGPPHAIRCEKPVNDGRRNEFIESVLQAVAYLEMDCTIAFGNGRVVVKHAFLREVDCGGKKVFVIQDYDSKNIGTDKEVFKWEVDAQFQAKNVRRITTDQKITIHLF